MWKSWIGGPFSIISDVALGFVVACGAEARKTLTNDDADDDPVAALEQNPSLAGQKAALWRVTGAAASVARRMPSRRCGWQLLVALSEELYYRGLIQGSAPAPSAPLLVVASWATPYLPEARRPSSPWRTRASSRTWRTARARSLAIRDGYGLDHGRRALRRVLALEFAVTGHRRWRRWRRARPERGIRGWRSGVRPRRMGAAGAAGGG